MKDLNRSNNIPTIIRSLCTKLYFLIAVVFLVYSILFGISW